MEKNTQSPVFMKLDERIDNQRLRQFASQLSAVPNMQKIIVQQARETIVGDQTAEFYLGLCAGLAASYQIASQPNAQQIIGIYLAAAAERALHD